MIFIIVFARQVSLKQYQAAGKFHDFDLIQSV